MSNQAKSAKRKQFVKNRKDVEKQMQSKIATFNKIPESCNFCQEVFDKKSKEHASTWRVAIWGEDIYLACPKCQANVNKLTGNSE